MDNDRLWLETPRLVLRSFQAADAHTFSEYRSDPEVARYQGWEAPYSLEKAVAFVEAMQRVKPGTVGQWYQLAIQLKSSGVMIGDCAFVILPEDSEQAEIGFTLARAFHGQGYGSEAVERLLGYLFGTLYLHRVRGVCDVENMASARLMERLGMRREAHFIENAFFKGVWGSEYWYALLDYEWVRRKSEL